MQSLNTIQKIGETIDPNDGSTELDLRAGHIPTLKVGQKALRATTEVVNGMEDPLVTRDKLTDPQGTRVDVHDIPSEATAISIERSKATGELSHVSIEAHPPVVLPPEID